MIVIKVVKEVAAPPDRVWAIIQDIDMEPKYWRGTKSVKNLDRNGNIIQREVVIAFRNSKCRQTVTLEPPSKLRIDFIDGPIKGSKTVSIESLDNKTIITAFWEIKFNGILELFSSVIRNHICEGTHDALERIAVEASA